MSISMDDLLVTLYAPSSPTTGAIASALAKAQGTVEHAAKTSTNPQTRSKYADLASILDVAREPLSTNGLSIVQAPYHLPGDPPGIVLVTTIMHDSGEWVRSVMPVNPRVKVSGGGGAVATVDDMQTIGSAITYARRYALAAMLGIGQEDDDGNHASGRARPTAAQEAPRRNAPAPEAPRPESAPAGPSDGPTAEERREDAVNALTFSLKAQEVPPKSRMPFIRFIAGRKIKTPLEMTDAELARMNGWDADAWEAALADYAVASEGGPPEPDWTGVPRPVDVEEAQYAAAETAGEGAP